MQGHKNKIEFACMTATDNEWKLLHKYTALIIYFQYRHKLQSRFAGQYCRLLYIITD